MAIKNCKLNLRTSLVCGVFSLVIVLLSGCGNTMESVPSSISKDCEEAQVLMTDLTVLENQRQYMLSDGRLCPSHQVINQEPMNDDNKYDKEESRNDKSNQKNK